MVAHWAGMMVGESAALKAAQRVARLAACSAAWMVAPMVAMKGNSWAGLMVASSVVPRGS